MEREVIFKPGEIKYLTAGNQDKVFRTARRGLVAFLANSEELENLVREAKYKIAERSGGKLRFAELPECLVFVSFEEVLEKARKAAVETLQVMYEGNLEKLSQQIERLLEWDGELWRACRKVYDVTREYDGALAEEIYWHPTLTQGLAVIAEDVAKYVTIVTGRAPKGWRIVAEVM